MLFDQIENAPSISFIFFFDRSLQLYIGLLGWSDKWPQAPLILWESILSNATPPTTHTVHSITFIIFENLGDKHYVHFDKK